MTLPKINNNERGFTIVELLIVIIVIGILAALVLVGYNGIQAQARDTKRKQNANSVVKAMDVFKSTGDTNYYPRVDTGANFQTDVKALTVNGVATNTISVGTAVSDNLSTSAPSNTSNATKDAIQVVFCPANATYQTATGARVYYYKEVSNSNDNISVGTC